MVTAALRHATRVSSRAAVVLWLTSLQHQGGPLIPHVPTLCSSSSTGVKEIQDFCGALEGHPLFTHAGVTATLRSACSSPRRALLDDVFLCIVDACGDMYREVLSSCVFKCCCVTIVLEVGSSTFAATLCLWKCGIRGTAGFLFLIQCVCVYHLVPPPGGGGGV